MSHKYISSDLLDVVEFRLSGLCKLQLSTPWVVALFVTDCVTSMGDDSVVLCC